uniref:Uncharacterized protein n=1 Tax=Globisporangium ultimum (strain ATCC 200006 / CBS 805.95 / DAOM BR144) TaxID=431595 RepID=K3WYW9_GLOUD
MHDRHDLAGLRSGMAPPSPTMVPLGHQYYQHQPPAQTEFVCNVSDDDTVERDIDLEIEARMRSLTFLSDEENVLSLNMGLAAKPATASMAAKKASPELPKTTSQRMLSSLQRNKTKQMSQTERSVSAGVRQQPVSATVGASNGHSESGNYRQYSDPLAARERITRSTSSTESVEGSQLSSGRGSSTSAAERLEARISKSLLSRQDSFTSAADGNDFSSMYSGRRTYPAESVKKNDQRLSEGTPLPAQPETGMMAALEKELERAKQMKVLRGARVTEPLVDKTPKEKKQDAGVSFHFYGGSSTTAPTKNRLALTMDADPAHYGHQQSHAMVIPARPSSTLDSKYSVLANQLGDIEKLIDGIERCLSPSTVHSLASMVLGELDLLKGSTKQIRTNGATHILAEVGRPPTETVNALRRLVARAVAVQKRIEGLMASVRQMVA